MPKFGIAAIISAVRSPLQFAALMAILIFLAFLVLRFSPRPEAPPDVRCWLDLSGTGEPAGARNLFCITLEYGRPLH